MSPVIRVENLSKQYRLGQVGTGTLSADLTRLWYRLRGKEDPFLKIGQTNDRTKKADSPTQPKKKGLLSSLSPLASSPSDLVWALKDINFEVNEGEVLGIIGRNGAGKSTLLKILARVTMPTTGQAKIKGRLASLLEVGTGFHPDLTGRENIYLNGAILGMRKHEITRKLDEIIDFSGCERYIDTPVKRYSSGMYVRLAFAVAAHLDSEILIVDEVLAVGDAEFQKKCLGKMKDVASGGRTVLFVSHNMGAVSQLCSRGVVIEEGSIALCDTANTCIGRYLAVDSDATVYFEAKSDQALNFVSARLENSRGIVTKNFRHDEPIYVAMKYKNTAAKPQSELGMRVLSQEGIVVFTTQRSHDVVAPLPRDLNSARVGIPAHFLTPGNYSITIAAHVPNVEVLDLKESALSFRIEETGSKFSRYASTQLGVVFCECEWEDSPLYQCKTNDDSKCQPQ